MFLLFDLKMEHFGAVFKLDLTEETRTQLQEDESIIVSSCLILATPVAASLKLGDLGQRCKLSQRGSGGDIITLLILDDENLSLSPLCLFEDVFIKPPPPVGAGGGYMFSGRPSVRLFVRPSVRDSRGSFMFPRYLQYLLTDFRQTFVTGASWDTDDWLRFWVKRQSSRLHHRGGGAQHSTLPSSATFSSCGCFLSFETKFTVGLIIF